MWGGFQFRGHSQNPMETNKGGGGNPNFNLGEGDFNTYMTNNMYPWPGQGDY